MAIIEETGNFALFCFTVEKLVEKLLTTSPKYGILSRHRATRVANVH
jgi:hypothetical protein